MALISGGGGGGLPLTGGTITGALTVNDTGGAEAALTVRGDHLDNTVEIYPGGGSYAIIDSVGRMELYRNDAGGEAKLLLDDANGGQTSISSVNGIAIQGLLATAYPFKATAGGGEFRLDPTARPVVATHSAPADGGLTAGQCAIWFDQTNAAAKLMLKAKSADGTVVTGSVNLA